MSRLRFCFGEHCTIVNNFFFQKSDFFSSKNLHNSKKSSNFAQFFVRVRQRVRRLKHRQSSFNRVLRLRAQEEL